MGGGASSNTAPTEAKYKSSDQKSTQGGGGLEAGFDFNSGGGGGGGIDLGGDMMGGVDNNSNLKGVSAGKLKKMALGQSSYNDTDRSYKPGDVVQIHKTTKNVEQWDGSKGPHLASAPLQQQQQPVYRQVDGRVVQVNGPPPPQRPAAPGAPGSNNTPGTCIYFIRYLYIYI